MSQHDTYNETIFHPFTPVETDGIVLPLRFNNPFYYQPQPLCILAAEKLKEHIDKQTEWAHEIERGKMFGVLIAKDRKGTIPCNISKINNRQIKPDIRLGTGRGGLAVPMEWLEKLRSRAVR